MPIPAAATHPRRVDYGYERAGTASTFTFVDPPAGWREVRVRPHRTRIDRAREMAASSGTRYARCGEVIPARDNLNTHTPGAFHEAFEPRKAGELVNRTDVRHTPGHGGRLNIAERELSPTARQCLADRRLGEADVIREEVMARATDINKIQRDVQWRFTVNDAQVKLESLYPEITL